jgi:alcohol dehydrogenase
VPAAFESFARTRLVFGNGSVSRLGELARELGARRVLVVSDPGLTRAGHVLRALRILEDARCATVPFDDVSEEPDARDVARCVEAIGVFGPELLVALGGGSAIDTAKAAAILAANGGRMQDYWGYGKTRAPLLPIVAVPTTAGTGSEVQSYALIADERTGQKMACGASDAAPRLALLDPELSTTCPPFVTACAGLDALGHALETAVTTKRNPASDLYARAAFGRLAASFARVLAAPADLEARGAMLLGACWAGLAIEHSMLGVAHSLANPLSARLGLVHGLAVGLALPAVVRFNAVAPEPRRIYAELARESGLAARDADESASLAGLLTFLGACLEALGGERSAARAALSTADLSALAEEAGTQWTARFNPRPVTRPELEALLAELQLPA